MIYNKKSYAKVNIGLHVLNKREDNYHNLSTYFHKIDLFDDIQIEILPSSGLSVNIKGNESYLTSGLDLMEKAAVAFSAAANIKFCLNIIIEKRIPHQAGLAGGSSNAATILKTLNEHFNIYTTDELITLSLTVGSDLAFFIYDKSAAYALSRGELLSEVESVKYPILLIKKGSVSTSSAFSKIKPYKKELPAWTTDLALWPKLYTNDFDIIQEIREEELFVNALKNYYNTTTGSGAAQVVIFSSFKEREDFILNNNLFISSYSIYLSELI